MFSKSLALAAFLVSSVASAATPAFKCTNEVYRKSRLEFTPSELMISDTFFMKGKAELSNALAEKAGLSGFMPQALTLQIPLPDLKCEEAAPYLFSCHGGSQRMLLAIEGIYQKNGVGARITLYANVPLKGLKLQSKLSSPGGEVLPNKVTTFELSNIEVEGASLIELDSKIYTIDWSQWYSSKPSEPHHALHCERR